MYIVYYSQVSQLVSLTFSDVVILPYVFLFACFRWDKTCKQKYQQFACRTFGCETKVQTYCICHVGEWMCKSCFVDHILTVNK